MSAVTARGPARPGLLEKLLAAVRPEFRVDVYRPDPNDPVLGYKICGVEGCSRTVNGNGLCSGHVGRWRDRGRPELEVFLADPGPRMRGLSEPGGCVVSGCGYGIFAGGLCSGHHDRWVRSGSPEKGRWASTALIIEGDAAACRLPFCGLWAQNLQSPFCAAHTGRWQLRPSMDAEQFIEHCLNYAKPAIDMRALTPQLRLEFQYALQCRHDRKTSVAPPGVLRLATRVAAQSGVTSLLALPEARWRQMGADCSPDSKILARACAHLAFACEVVGALLDGTGWEVEYHRDDWRVWMLPGLKTHPSRARSRSHLRFDTISQPWLRELGKRWVRLRLVSGLSISTAITDVQALTRFSQFLTVASPEVRDLSCIDRPLLERYLAWLKGQPGGVSANEGRVGGLHLFFQAIRQHGWDDSLPTTAAFFAGDCPRRRQRLTRYLAEHVMAQVEHPANLDRWTHPEGKLITVILVRCGLRVSDACTLNYDCVILDGQGAPYLRYYNNKMSREAAVPIDEELHRAVREQQLLVLQRWPQGNPNLFPRLHSNADGSQPFSPDSYRAMMKRWLARCEVTDEQGQPVNLTPHQWRHTFATRLINRDVPQEVIRVLLDHESSQMTSHYAKITDQTVRRRWAAATMVNIKGERVSLDPDGPLAQAQWAKARFDRATQTLPNGCCGLPVQKSCPHANACLTCPVFITDAGFLPELRAQRANTAAMIEAAYAKGQTRIAEMNRQVLTNLDRMIEEIVKNNEQGTADAS